MTKDCPICGEVAKYRRRALVPHGTPCKGSGQTMAACRFYVRVMAARARWAALGMPYGLSRGYGATRTQEPTP